MQRGGGEGCEEAGIVKSGPVLPNSLACPALRIGLVMRSTARWRISRVRSQLCGVTTANGMSQGVV